MLAAHIVQQTLRARKSVQQLMVARLWRVSRAFTPLTASLSKRSPSPSMTRSPTPLHPLIV